MTWKTQILFSTIKNQKGQARYEIWGARTRRHLLRLAKCDPFQAVGWISFGFGETMSTHPSSLVCWEHKPDLLTLHIYMFFQGLAQNQDGRNPSLQTGWEQAPETLVWQSCSLKCTQHEEEQPSEMPNTLGNNCSTCSMLCSEQSFQRLDLSYSQDVWSL